MTTSFPDSHIDLLDPPRAGALATHHPNGTIQVTAVMLTLEDGALKFSAHSERRKVRNLLARPECTYFVIDAANPQRTIEVRARARLEPDVDLAFAIRAAATRGAPPPRYADTDPPGSVRYCVTLEPTSVVTHG